MVVEERSRDVVVVVVVVMKRKRIFGKSVPIPPLIAFQFPRAPTT